MQNAELEKLIEKQPKKKFSVVDSIFDNPYFVRSKEYGSTIENYSEEIVFNNTGSDKYIYFVFGFMIFIFGFRAIEDVFSRYLVFGLFVVLILLVWYNKTKKIEEIKKIAQNKIIITTEKDFVRLKGSLPIEQLFYLPIKTKLLFESDNFDKIITNYVESCTRIG